MTRLTNRLGRPQKPPKRHLSVMVSEQEFDKIYRAALALQAPSLSEYIRYRLGLDNALVDAAEKIDEAENDSKEKIKI